MKEALPPSAGRDLGPPPHTWLGLGACRTALRPAGSLKGHGPGWFFLQSELSNSDPVAAKHTCSRMVSCRGLGLRPGCLSVINNTHSFASEKPGMGEKRLLTIALFHQRDPEKKWVPFIL